MNDWDRTYIAAALSFLHGLNPYSATKFFGSPVFGSPPYSMLFLVPLVWIPPQLARFFPFLALLFLSVRFHKPLLLLLVGTSFPFIASSAYANIDWMIMLGVALGGPIGVILDTIKPQAGAFAVVAEIAKRRTFTKQVRLLLPLIVCVLFSIPLLASWVYWMLAVGHTNDGIRNFSLFPFTIPLGITAIYLAWKNKSPIWGCVASLSLSPYFYINSALPLVFLLAKRDWRLGVIANLTIWGIVGLIVAGAIPIKL